MKYRVRLAVLALLLAVVDLQLSSVFAQGSLTPPGAPGPTMKSLAQIEPRTPISAAPFTISEAGSYYLTTNLTGISGAAGVTITASDVTIELNGFALIGVAGSADGFLLSGVVTNITIRNGTVRNFGGNGINGPSAHDCTFQELRALNNGSGSATGIAAGVTTTVKDCIAEGNSFYGITVGEGCLVSGCTVRTNASGIAAGNGTVVTDCSSMDNTGYGYYAYSGVTIQNCSARGNTSLGIGVHDGCTVTACSSSLNGSYGIWTVSGAGGGGTTISRCSVTGNLADGIYVGDSGNTVVGNTCSYNGLASSTNYAGIRIDGTDNRVEDNDLVGNQNRGLRVTVAGNFIVRNVASFNGVDYDTAGTQNIGPIVTTTGTITTNSPWANFEF